MAGDLFGCLDHVRPRAAVRHRLVRSSSPDPFPPSPLWVIPAAHCTKLMNVSHSVIIAGKAYGFTRTVMFPGGGEGKDDIALLELAQAVKDVTPIPIYDGRDEATGDKMVVFVGQGY